MKSLIRLRPRLGLVKGAGLLIGVILGIWLYIYAYDRIRIVRLDNLFDPAYGFQVGRREQFFAQKFPSSSDIKAYLHDSTILLSNPPIGNQVYYFDRDDAFISWYDSKIEAGKWRSFPNLQILRLDGKWRIAVVYAFCISYPDRDAIAQRDNCYEIESVDSILSRGSRREYRKGNVFNLGRDKPTPARLPKSEITIESLLPVKPSEQKN